MSRRNRVPTPPPRIYSLTERQAKLLREAVEAPTPGLYIGVCATDEGLIDGGAAEYHVERRSGGTKSVHDDRPCEWNENYLVPTAYGLELLAAAVRK